MKAAAWLSAHRRSVLFLVALLALAGALAAFRLPVSLFPTVQFPRVSLSLDAGDQPANQMELQVTRPVEEAVRSIAGVTNVRSTTSRGSAEVSVSFDWGTDMAAATLQVNAAVAQIQAQLPPGTRVAARRMDPTVFPIIAYSLTSASLSPTALRDLASYQLRPLLSGIAGVATVQVQGGASEEVRVTADPRRLQAYGLSMDDLSKALAAGNSLSATGRLEDHYKLYLVLADTRLAGVEDVRQTVVANGANGVVRIGDVASVARSTTPEWQRVTADGRDAVLLSIRQQPGSNSVQIAADVKAALDGFAPQLPKDVHVANWYDQSELVTASASSVRDAILIGVVLAALVLVVFLRNLRVTAIAVVVVPAVLAITIVVLQLLGMSFNIMTLGGMAAAVGLVIDDAIVMIEHIERRLAETADSSGGAAGARLGVVDAAMEFLRPLAGSSAATLVIFAPLAFLSGVTGAFFKALSLTMASALAISFLVTWLAVPLLAHFLLGRQHRPARDDRVTRWFKLRYRHWLVRCIARPWVLVVCVALLLGAGGFAFRQVGTGFMPSMDEGGFILDYRTPPGTALSETDRLLRQVEAIVRATPEVQTYSRRTATGLGGGLSETNQGDFFIRLKPGRRRPVQEVMQDVRNRVEHQVPGVNVELAQLMEDLIGDLTAVPQPVEVKLFAADPKLLPGAAEQVAQRIAKVPGLVEVRSGINPAGDAIAVHVDRVAAAVEGLDPDQVTRALQTALAGSVATSYAQETKIVGVRVWTPAGSRATQAQLDDLPLRAPDGHLVPLRRIATFETLSGQPQITRENLKSMIAVTGRIEGRDLGSVVQDVKQTLAAGGALPGGVYYELGGLYQQQQIAFKGLMTVFAAAAALVFLLLLFLYESFAVAASILCTSLLSVSAVFIGLWLTGIELNISAMMGMTMIIGIVTEVAVFYFSEQRQRHRPGRDLRRSLVGAGQFRARPIAMTTLAAILTLLPLALAIGAGSEMQQPLAVAIISGLVVQLPLVLFFMPTLYAWIEKAR
ncbi:MULTISPECIES: efflux RND transporter permease subunit [Variovorax]|uniref:efflux RND transporter permease subunit n=1 Tax=Variovorax TaxID=34072 RepID=UPI00086CE1F6|nr:MULTISPECIES: efflux RND transporter permease subunit [Variovorax]MBN8757303.1 efflux RND transporter permease subunit [Variovorax sp.]ODU17980.1 MAG: transporter [Variovorax sp. SCN 67-85]ODV24515.1 MAG: transporter [Variovorax sp. SCN 67-20]OJZ13546.1 MAG: transporter [Variovorax sp. 67-131]UKI06194.1 efflux RND transporter permease subunit [Variovorax paradoxus]